MWNPFFGMKKTYTHLVRYRHIMGVLIKYGFEEVAGIFARRLKIGLGSKGLPGVQKQTLAATTLPQRVRMAMEELGPTFIKLGQLLSTRPDLVSDDYVQEFEHLQDRVTPERYETIRRQVVAQLGAEPEVIFESFDPVPIAAASIAQVHRAKTKDGDEVVVKIRRPDIVKTLRTEMEILQDIAGLVKSRLLAPETFDPVRMVNEFSQAVSKEVDLANERRNQQRFIHNFKDDPTVHVPRVFEEYCSEGILTMEYIEGIKPNHIQRLENADLDPKLIAQRGADFVLRQIFDFGFFHTDPHPGNFLVMEDNILAPLDFGQVGRLTQQDRMLLQYLVLSIVNADASKIVSGLERAQLLDDDVDITEFSRDVEDILMTYENQPLKDIPFGQVIRRIFDIIRRHRVEAPRDFTLMLKCLMTIESFATDLDEDFQIIESLKPYARRFSVEDLRPDNLFRRFRKATYGATELAARLPEDAGAIIQKFRRGKFKIHVHHEHLEELEQTLDNSSNRIAFAVIIAALLIGSSLLVPQNGDVLGIISLQTLGILGYITAMIMGMWLVISIIRSRRF
jgi:ubiquinone biosynthesis protein